MPIVCWSDGFIIHRKINCTSSLNFTKLKWKHSHAERICKLESDSGKCEWVCEGFWQSSRSLKGMSILTGKYGWKNLNVLAFLYFFVFSICSKSAIFPTSPIRFCLRNSSHDRPVLLRLHLPPGGAAQSSPFWQGRKGEAVSCGYHRRLFVWRRRILQRHPVFAGGGQIGTALPHHQGQHPGRCGRW